jgi:hypothetical protein
MKNDLEIEKKTLGEDHSNLASIYYILGDVYDAQEKYEEAERYTK